MARRAEDVKVAPGKVLVTEGERGHRVLRDPRRQGPGDDATAGRWPTLGPGKFFGDLALLDRAPATRPSSPRPDMELVVLGQREFAALIDEAPGFARKLLAGSPAASARPTPEPSSKL